MSLISFEAYRRAAVARSGAAARITRVSCAGAALLCVAIPTARAYAACNPTITHIDPAQTSASVSWIETCPGPGSMQLLQNGTAPNFQNGKLLGIDLGLTTFQNGGVVTTNRATLSPGTPYDTLRLCAAYSTQPAATIYCTNPFALKTLAAAAPPVTLQIISPTSTPTSVTFSWTLPPQFQTYHVRLDNLNEQTVTHPPPFTYGYPPLTPSTRYQVSVEGCTDHGVTGNACTNQWVAAYITTQVAPPVIISPPVPVTSKTYSMKPFGAGDCTLTNGVVTFRSDGTFSFTAQVRTRHTTTSDYWHVILQLFNSSNQDIENIPEFTGPAMKDAHPGAYTWSHNGTFAPSVYPALSSLHMPSRC